MFVKILGLGFGTPPTWKDPLLGEDEKDEFRTWLVHQKDYLWEPRYGSGSVELEGVWCGRTHHALPGEIVKIVGEFREYKTAEQSALAEPVTI